MNTPLNEFDSLADRTSNRLVGFVFADRFDVLLRNISAQYLGAAWKNLQSTLAGFRVAPSDLSWGWLNPGHSSYNADLEDAPSDLTGWTSSELYFSGFFRDKRYDEIDERLKAASPSLRLADSYRSLKWNISPQDYERALHLLEALWTDGISEWRPAYILEQDRNQTGLWGEIANAIARQEQTELDDLLARARREYTSTGYSIVVRGFTNFVADGENVDDIDVHLPALLT